MKNQETLIKEILDANLEELLEHDLYTTQLSQPYFFYLKVLISYLKADFNESAYWHQKIEETFQENPTDELLKALFHCSLVRLKIRENVVEVKDLDFIVQMTFQSPWSHEAEFILGMAYLRLSLFETSSQLFFKSYTGFSKIGCRRKALIAYQNHVVSKVNLHPNRSYLAEWSFLVKMARKEKNTSMEGGALINLSREYQNITSYDPALNAIDQALVSLSESIGTYQYYHALLQKCDILLLLGRNSQAYEVFQQVKLCPFLELKSTIELLESKINPDKCYAEIQTPESFPWKERLEEMKLGKKKKPHGNLVQQLIQELEQEPQDKFSLIEKLYPENIEFQIKENRFNVLLSKIRKQHPGLICKEGNFYKLEMSNEWLKKKLS